MAGNTEVHKALLKRVSLTLFFCLLGWHSVCLAANSTPSVGTITPSSATGQVKVSQIFRATYSDP
ncbi:MAG: hypothetical protein V1925_05690, partial [Candidatus Omnitrophota bacterium]